MRSEAFGGAEDQKVRVSERENPQDLGGCLDMWSNGEGRIEGQTWATDKWGCFHQIQKNKQILWEGTEVGLDTFLKYSGTAVHQSPYLLNEGSGSIYLTGLMYY